jgi:hypothetical protein
MWLTNKVSTAGLVDGEALVRKAVSMSAPWIRFLSALGGTAGESLEVDIPPNSEKQIWVQLWIDTFDAGNYSSVIAAAWTNNGVKVASSLVSVSYTMCEWPMLMAAWNDTRLCFHRRHWARDCEGW